MEYHILWSPEALMQLEQAVRFIARDNPPAAERMGEAILQKGLLLKSFPRIGRVFAKLQRENVREVPVPPYRIIYQIDDDSRVISILSVWHSARQPPDL